MKLIMGVCSTVMLLAVTIMVAGAPTSSPSLCDIHWFRHLTKYGYIMSPNYPGRYSSQSCSTWIYYGTPGTQISIRLLDLDIPSKSYTCNNDFLMIGPINEQTYCGNIDSMIHETYKAQLTSSQHWLYVVFNSTNVGKKGRGFKLYYQFSNTFDSSVNSTTGNISNKARKSGTGHYRVNGLHNSVTSCHFVLTARAGLISTNSTVLNCLKKTGRATWLIYSSDLAEAKMNYKLHFKHCYLPYEDSLKIYDGYSNTDRVMKYVGSMCSSCFISSHHAFFIEYLKQDTDSFPSFKLQFQSVGVTETNVTELPKHINTTAENPALHFSDKCIFQFSHISGEINSDDLMSAARNTGYCSWLFYMHGTDGHHVIYTLSFERFQMSQNSIFKIYDGEDTSAPTLGTYSSVRPFFSVTSSQNKVFMYYSPGITHPMPFIPDAFTVKYHAYVRCAQGYEPCGYNEFSCFREDNRCDGIWQCPLHGGDERGCVVECPTDFSCDIRGSNCYTENDRCNGKGNCSNYVDELGCTEDRCSPDKGLYLCRNGRCIYENWKCDRMNDCFDNSDEDGCSVLSSPRVIVAAVVGSLLCALLLVIAVGCVCKVYYLRARQLHGGPHHETPLSRQLAEMFYHRAPPPPYHEAMLTSRPFDEAYLELLGHAEQHSEASDNSSQQNPNPEPQRERSHRNNQQINRSRRHHIQRHHDQSSRRQSETERLTEVSTLPQLLEVIQDGALRQGSSADSAPPPYSECCHSITAESCCCNSEDESHDSENRLGGVENSGYVGDNDSHISGDGEPVIPLEVIPSATIRRSVDLTSGLCLRNCSGIQTDEERSINNASEEGDVSNKNTETASTSLSLNTSRMIIGQDDNKVDQEVSTIDEDSDSDCILDGNIAEDVCDNNDDDTDSDTCILDA